MLRVGSITPSFLKKLYEETKNMKPTFTPEERELYNYYNMSRVNKYTHNQGSYNPRYDELGRLFFEHCIKPCCLGDSASMCMLHRTYAMYCVFHHFMEKTDFRTCPTCTVISFKDKCRLHEAFQQQSFLQDPLYGYVAHIRNCSGCWKCKQLHNPLVSTTSYRPTSIYSSSETSSNPANDLIPVPKGIFYTQESDEPNHSGYLRIIPLTYENTVTSCDDYQDLVQTMNEDAKYIEARDFSYKRIENEEREYRSVLSSRQPVFEQYQQKYGVTIKQECVEELAISLKKYLIHVLCYCQEERQLCGQDKDSDEFVIDENLLLRVLKRHQYCVSKMFSLYHFCVC